jgi:tRNA-2-methylthio-N6-dimethylallyladenosine synthase
MRKKVYIETMGCQMNKLDSELIAGQLTGQGYEICDEIKESDVIIFNTCSVRHHAEEKVISKIGQLRKEHQQRPELVLAVVGCMAQRMGQELLDTHREVDIACAPSQIHRFGDMLKDVLTNRGRLLCLNNPDEIEQLEELDGTRNTSERDHPFAAFVRVMRGCNKFCNYCVVPYVRGRERSRPIEHIVTESRRLVDHGVKEITLLGQTVNSYQYVNGEKTYRLADVIEKLHAIDGLEQIRFVTSYPRDFDESILRVMADLPKVCEYLHIPAQAGSNRILKAMNRHYTMEQYLDLIDKARQIVPGITIAGDFIVGYCGETDQDFEQTKELVRKVRYKNCFIFKYSPRPGTRADEKLVDDVPDEIKRQRNTELLELQNKISFEDNQRFINQTVEVLVEGPSKKPHLNNSDNDSEPSEASHAKSSRPSTSEYLQLVGRTRGDHIVVFNGHTNLIGQIQTVDIIKASSLTLFGEIQP